MQTDENSRKYFTDLLHDIRTGFISTLFYETILAAESPDAENQIILANWCNDKAKQIWMPDCEAIHLSRDSLDF